MGMIRGMTCQRTGIDVMTEDLYQRVKNGIPTRLLKGLVNQDQGKTNY